MPSSLQRLISLITFGSFFFSVAYFSHMNTVFQYDTESANALGRDFSSLAQYLYTRYDLKSTPYTGFCTSIKTREDGNSGVNGDAAMYKRTGIKYVLTTWTPSE